MGRGGKLAVKLLVPLLVVGGGFVVADRIAVRVAANRIGQEVQAALESRGTVGGTPSVAIAGFPFLTQVMAGEYEKISIDIDQPKISGVQLDRLDLVARDVKADTRAVLAGTGEVRAAEVVGTAKLTWDTVREILTVAGLPNVDPSGVQLTAQDDELRLRLPIPVLGPEVVLLGTGRFELADGVVRLRVNSVQVEGGPLPAILQQSIDQLQLSATLGLPELPYQLRVDRVTSSSSGLTVRAVARDVTLAG
jgi:hypothetical protein